MSTLDSSPSPPTMAEVGSSAVVSNPPPSAFPQSQSPPQPQPTEDEESHPPPRSFSTPQFPYPFHPRTTPNSAAPSLLDATLSQNHDHAHNLNLTFPRHVNLDAFSPLCASARTSYTRVDVPTAPGTPELVDVGVVSRVRTSGEGRGTERPGAEGNEGEEEEEGDDDADDDVDPEKGRARREDEEVPQIPQVVLTFLLVSGRRRTMAFDPETTIGRAKELVWNAWPNEWQDERPPAPSYLRILYLGKILQDDDTLAKWSFPVTQPAAPSTPPQQQQQQHQQPTIVHLSIRAYAPAGAEDAPKKKRRRGGAGVTAGAGEEAGEEAGCCSCVIC